MPGAKSLCRPTNARMSRSTTLPRTSGKHPGEGCRSRLMQVTLHCPMPDRCAGESTLGLSRVSG